MSLEPTQHSQCGSGPSLFAGSFDYHDNDDNDKTFQDSNEYIEYLLLEAEKYSVGFSGYFQDKHKEFELNKEAANLGSAEGLENIGIAYMYGKEGGSVVKKDANLALNYFQKAVKLGKWSAYTKIIELYIDHDKEEDAVEAAKNYINIIINNLFDRKFSEVGLLLKSNVLLKSNDYTCDFLAHHLPVIKNHFYRHNINLPKINITNKEKKEDIYRKIEKLYKHKNQAHVRFDPVNLKPGIDIFCQDFLRLSGLFGKIFSHYKLLRD